MYIKPFFHDYAWTVRIRYFDILTIYKYALQYKEDGQIIYKEVIRAVMGATRVIITVVGLFLDVDLVARVRVGNY